MSVYGAVLRQRIEALILGTAGTNRTMTAGRFHLEAADAARDGGPVNAIERAVKVTVRPGVDLVPYNSLDGFVLRRHVVEVRVSYARTNAGGDLGEALSEQSGSGTVESIEDRANADAHAIQYVLDWHENRAGTDPSIINIAAQTDAPELEFSEDAATLTLLYTLDVQATMPGSYGT